MLSTTVTIYKKLSLISGLAYTVKFEILVNLYLANQSIFP